MTILENERHICCATRINPSRWDPSCDHKMTTCHSPILLNNIFLRPHFSSCSFPSVFSFVRCALPKKSISELRHFSSNGPEKTNSHFVFSSYPTGSTDNTSRRSRLYANTNMSSWGACCLLSRSVVHRHARDGGVRQVCLTQFLYVTWLPLFRKRERPDSRCFTQWCRNSWMQTFPLRHSSKWCVSFSALWVSH